MTGKYTGSVNPHNKTSLQLNRKIKTNQPSLRTIGKWRLEWVESGNDKRTSFQLYKKSKCKQWHLERYLKKKII